MDEAKTLIASIHVHVCVAACSKSKKEVDEEKEEEFRKQQVGKRGVSAWKWTGCVQCCVVGSALGRAVSKTRHGPQPCRPTAMQESLDW